MRQTTRRQYTLFAALALLAFAIVPLHATPIGTPAVPAAGTYQVNTKFFYQRKLFASPQVIVYAGQQVHMKVSNDEHYELALKVTKVAPDKLRVTMRMASSHGTVARKLVVYPDQLARITDRDFRISVIVHPIQSSHKSSHAKVSKSAE